MRHFRFLACAALLLALAPATLGHARLLRSAPAIDAEVSSAPEHIELWFNELLDHGFNSVTVFPAKELAAPKRTNLVKGKPTLNAEDRTHLTVAVESLAPGEYVVEWRVLSRDGHSAPGRMTFRILAP